jgi:hypothetical protein
MPLSRLYRAGLTATSKPNPSSGAIAIIQLLGQQLRLSQIFMDTVLVIVAVYDPQQRQVVVNASLKVYHLRAV